MALLEPADVAVPEAADGLVVGEVDTHCSVAVAGCRPTADAVVVHKLAGIAVALRCVASPCFALQCFEFACEFVLFRIIIGNEYEVPPLVLEEVELILVIDDCAKFF